MENTNTNIDYSTLTNDELYIQYQEARNNFFRAELGTDEETEAENTFRKISREVSERKNFDLAMYKMQSQLQIESLTVIQEQPNQNKTNLKGSNNMRTIRGLIKSAVIAGIITIMTVIPTMADTNDSSILNHYTNSKGDVVTVYKDKTTYINSDVNIQSLDYLDNSVTIEKDSQLYKFYVDEPREYYLNEAINITFNNNNEIIDCVVDSKPQVYNTQIDSITDDIATLSVNGNKYTFENTEGSDGWNVGEKCKVVIQDGRLLEVRPIPLSER